MILYYEVFLIRVHRDGLCSLCFPQPTDLAFFFLNP